ncbi:hypothetical protein V502_06686 [Pseudogymnoascus sp. VKM F-4520 (FW-2644)]|nr:hypothetical protein V502_06686 [Pseudogymnoascus sp. VKM F-4520 (FW-2644)]
MIQLPRGVRRIHIALVAWLLIAVWIWLAFDQLYYFLNRTPWNILSDEPHSLLRNPTASDAFDFAPIESEAIKSICADTEWKENIVFSCNDSVGGIGNIRNSILNCVRYSISAGGSLVVPNIVLRNESDTAAIRTGIRAEFEYMFDRQHFRESLRLSCPGLRLYDTVEDINGKTFHEPIALQPESLASNKGLEPEKWRSLFYNWLGEHISDLFENTVVINLKRSYLSYPIYTDGDGFAMSFGKILKFRADTSILATKTLSKLAERYFYDVDLLKPILPNFFLGVHLRTEYDSQQGWPVGDWVYSRYETQSKLYLEQANSSSISHIYVASGDLEEVAKFKVDAAASNITVTTKFDLLDETDKATLKMLSWDQQGMVDFQVMTKASDFGGIGHSSFAWNIALLRHKYAERKDHLSGPQLLSDELSQIYGKPHQYPEYARCLWP